MALIKCSECGKEISNKAKKCIYCKTKLNNNVKKNNFFIGVFVGVAISVIIFCLYVFLTTKKVEENNSKCLNTFDYDEAKNICIQSNMLMPNNNTCENGYIYDSYEDRCYKYIITPPLDDVNFTYEENIERANDYINQQ